MKIELFLAIVGLHTFYWELLITKNMSGKNICKSPVHVKLEIFVFCLIVSGYTLIYCRWIG